MLNFFRALLMMIIFVGGLKMYTNSEMDQGQCMTAVQTTDYVWVGDRGKTDAFQCIDKSGATHTVEHVLQKNPEMDPFHFDSPKTTAKRIWKDLTDEPEPELD